MINTLLVDLDDVMFDTGVVKKDLMQTLRDEYIKLHPDFVYQRVPSLVRKVYNHLKVEENCEVAMNVETLPMDLEERAIVQLAGPYGKFMTETLFDSSNQEKYFTPSDDLLDFLNHYFQGSLYAQFYELLIKDNSENERIWAEEKFNYLRFARRTGNTGLLQREYSCGERVLGVVTNGCSEIQRRKIVA